MSTPKGPYLRVLTPRTTDGRNLLYDENMRPKYKESHFELSAQKSLEEENLKRPVQLRHIIKPMGVAAPQMEVDLPVRTDFRPQRVPRQQVSLDDPIEPVVVETTQQRKEEKPKEVKKRVRRTKEQIQKDKEAKQ